MWQGCLHLPNYLHRPKKEFAKGMAMWAMAVRAVQDSKTTDYREERVLEERVLDRC
jgi:hypothetical protein